MRMFSKKFSLSKEVKFRGFLVVSWTQDIWLWSPTSLLFWYNWSQYTLCANGKV